MWTTSEREHLSTISDRWSVSGTGVVGNYGQSKQRLRARRRRHKKFRSPQGEGTGIFSGTAPGAAAAVRLDASFHYVFRIAAWLLVTGGSSATNFVFDALTDGFVNVLPVLDRVGQHRFDDGF